MRKVFLFTSILFCLVSCNSQPTNLSHKDSLLQPVIKNVPYDSSIKTIHVFVALCDNKYQGIVPVPPIIGNGQDPGNNLYWGCSAGIKTYFKKSSQWKLIRFYKLDEIKLERLIFENISSNSYLVADAYDGKFIKNCTIDFLKACAGQVKDTIKIGNKVAGIYGNSKLVAYIGHDGLMDFDLDEDYKNTDGTQRDAIILACKSKSYFSQALHHTKAQPLIWTTGLMCPEAYTLHDAVGRYLVNDSRENIRTAAATAYAKYQKCGLKAAKNLLVTGW
jgi:hypothetical protein